MPPVWPMLAPLVRWRSEGEPRDEAKWEPAPAPRPGPAVTGGFGQNVGVRGGERSRRGTGRPRLHTTSAGPVNARMSAVVGRSTGTVPLGDVPVEGVPRRVPAGSRRAHRSRRRSRNWWDALSVLAVWLLGAGFFFRSEWLHGFHMVMGDSHDSIHLTFLMEHWFQVLHGQSSWRSPAFFYPLKDVLGWSESMFLFQVFFAPLRLLGFDMFLAAQITIILLSLVGFASFVLLARAFGASHGISLLGGLAFTFANGLWQHMYWFQLLVIWMIPGILVLGVLAFRSFPGHRGRSLLLGGASGLLGGLVFFTSYYIAWFTSIAIAVGIAILLVVGRRRVLARVSARLRRAWSLVLAIAVMFAIGLVPALMTYLPSRRTVQSYNYASIMFAAPRPRDLLDVGMGNVLWTSTVHRVLPMFDLTYSALTYAVTPVVLGTAVIGSALAWWVSRKEDRTGWLTSAELAIVLAGTAIVLSVLPVKTSHGSLWAIIWHLPGAFAIRRTNRIEVVTGLVACLAMVTAASVLYRLQSKRGYGLIGRAAVILLLVLAVVEQYNTSPMTNLPRSAELAFLQSATAPPRGCRTFYVVDSAHRGLSPSSYDGHEDAVADQLDAMLVSQKFMIPTINGYTSYSPPNWQLTSPYAPDYLAGVAAWVRTYHLQSGLCQLDLATMRWQAAPSSVVRAS
jgi:hypothetical protein